MKALIGKIEFKMEIIDGNLNLNFDQNNENNLIAFEMVRKILQEVEDKKPIKSENLIIPELQKYINILAKYVIDKYKNAIPEEKKVKLLKYNPLLDNLPNLKGNGK